MATVVESVVCTVLAGVTKVGAVYYGDELKGLSKNTGTYYWSLNSSRVVPDRSFLSSGLPLGKLVMMQLMYAKRRAMLLAALLMSSPVTKPRHVAPVWCLQASTAFHFTFAQWIGVMRPSRNNFTAPVLTAVCDRNGLSWAVDRRA
jgi:hypothetical protein